MIFKKIVSFDDLMQIYKKDDNDTFTKFLISLPLDYFYMWVFFAFYGYKVTLRQSSFKGIMKNIVNYLSFYFKYVSRLEKKVKFSNNIGKKSLTVENINNLN